MLSLLILYRWASLVPAIAALLLDGRRPFALALLLAVSANLLISLRGAQLKRALQQRPWLLLADLAFVGCLIALTGGWQTPYHLYAYSPLLFAAFQFGLRGALLAATGFLPIYLGAVLAAASGRDVPPNWLQPLLAAGGFYLIGGAFGYASALVSRLQLARDALAHSHRDLQVIYDLTRSLQSAGDVAEVRQRVLQAVSTDLGFARAAIGLVDAETQTLVQWLVAPDAAGPNGARLPLSAAGGLPAQALLQRRVLPFDAPPLTPDAGLNAYLAIPRGVIFPMQLREHAIGVLIVAVEPHSLVGERQASLQAIANQAAVAMGTTMLCIDRTRALAVQEERIRIAQDIHDTVSQSLFGIVFTLDGSLKLLPEHPEAVIPELQRALQSADAVRQEIRSSILDLWPAQLTAERFTADLQAYAAATCQTPRTSFVFDIRGAFGSLTPGARRGLYRISQEALNNIAQHANADEARICVDVLSGRARLVIRDDGLGFEPEAALARSYDREHFGLRGMRERAHALGGSCQIYSKPGAGTSIVVDIPV